MIDPATSPETITGFWFSPDAKPNWFKKNDWFDSEIRARFENDYLLARDGMLDTWRDTPEGALALVILLDQLPRNMYRGTAQAFATDDKALLIADEALARDFDSQLSDDERIFLYMPFMHSESLAAQERGMALYDALGREENLNYMRRHYEIIARFGRFPHRNAVLGRQSTPEEAEFLTMPGSSF